MTSKLSVWNSAAYLFLTLQICYDSMVRGSLSRPLLPQRRQRLLMWTKGAKIPWKSSTYCLCPHFTCQKKFSDVQPPHRKALQTFPKQFWLTALPCLTHRGSTHHSSSRRNGQTPHSHCMALKTKNLLLYLLFSLKVPQHQELCTIKSHCSYLQSKRLTHNSAPSTVNLKALYR